MIDAFSLSDDTFLKIKAIRHVKKVVQREKQIYLRVLHTRCGLGLSVADFDCIVKELAERGWCYLTEGEYGGIVVVLNEHLSVPQIEVTHGEVVNAGASC